jgi:hypothetical protein
MGAGDTLLLALLALKKTANQLTAVTNTHLEQGEEVCVTDSSRSQISILLK